MLFLYIYVLLFCTCSIVDSDKPQVSRRIPLTSTSFRVPAHKVQATSHLGVASQSEAEDDTSEVKCKNVAADKPVKSSICAIVAVKRQYDEQDNDGDTTMCKKTSASSNRQTFHYYKQNLNHSSRNWNRCQQNVNLCRQEMTSYPRYMNLFPSNVTSCPQDVNLCPENIALESVAVIAEGSKLRTMSAAVGDVNKTSQRRVSSCVLSETHCTPRETMTVLDYPSKSSHPAGSSVPHKMRNTSTAIPISHILRQHDGTATQKKVICLYLLLLNIHVDERRHGLYIRIFISVNLSKFKQNVMNIKLASQL